MKEGLLSFLDFTNDLAGSRSQPNNIAWCKNANDTPNLVNFSNEWSLSVCALGWIVTDFASSLRWSRLFRTFLKQPASRLDIPGKKFYTASAETEFC